VRLGIFSINLRQFIREARGDGKVKISIQASAWDFGGIDDITYAIIWACGDWQYVNYISVNRMNNLKQIIYSKYFIERASVAYKYGKEHVKT